MFIGTVQHWKTDRGYGFVKRDDGGDDIFVHVSAVLSAGLADLKVGQRLQFDIQPDPRNPQRSRAINIRTV